ncbi:two-component system chemotaxis response regulator CheB [Sphingomonas sp. PvP055]|uniref:chemotaxis-specific protein-glutamate methyltransferase CheB n=1 Tax=Sphingomonas sp. PvP055 TaxID=3156391 RepID=UPI0033978579
MSEGDPSATVLIVDDSVVARAMISRAIEASGRFAVAGAVPNAPAALRFLRESQVDVIVLDIEMPGVTGLVALPDLIVAGRGAKVLIVSSVASDGAAATIEALAQGAADTLVKPDIGDFAGKFSVALVDKLDRLIARDEQVVEEVRVPVPPPEPPVAAARDVGKGFEIVAIGASTGGIHALNQVLTGLPSSFSLPILVTQHLPASFMPYFAAQLATMAGRPCDVATGHMRIRPGRIIVAPGDAHMRVVRTSDGAAIRLNGDPVRSGCMPSVDPMFASIAEVFGARALGIVLSGMGRDGSDGARTIVARGGSIVVQDRESSVVWGMPGSIAKSGDASAVMTPAEIGQLIANRRHIA